jgi:hypothetical protein
MFADLAWIIPDSNQAFVRESSCAGRVATECRFLGFLSDRCRSSGMALEDVSPSSAHILIPDS